MTNTEAIEWLDSKKVKLKEYEGWLGSAEMNEALDMAISALRAQQTPAKLDRSRWEGCPVCRGKEDDRGDENHIPRYRYCYVCGRPLTELAWAELERRINDGTADN